MLEDRLQQIGHSQLKIKAGAVLVITDEQRIPTDRQDKLIPKHIFSKREDVLLW